MVNNNIFRAAVKSATALSIASLLAISLNSTRAHAQSTSGTSGDMSDLTGTMHTIPLNAPIPPISIDAGSEEIDGASSDLSSSGSFSVSGGVTVVGGTEFVLKADSATGNFKTGVTTAVGHVFMRELDSTVDMDSIFVDQKVNEGTAQNVTLRQPPYTIQAQKIVFQPNETDAYNALFTTCPPGPKPEFSIQSRLIAFLPDQHELVIHDGTFYLWNHRVFTYKRLVLKTGSKSGVVTTPSKLFSDTVGYNGFSGAFAQITTHFGQSHDGLFGSLLLPEKHGFGVLVSDSVSLLKSRENKLPPAPKTLIGIVRKSAESTQPILPYGDPLLMHWFEDTTPMSDRFQDIPNTLTINATATASVRERVTGRYTNDLFYSRLPEVSVSAIVPISGPRDLPTSRDPEQMRRTLRQLALYAIVTPTIGRYSEYPDDITADRESIHLDIESRPILIGENLLFKPRMSFQNSSYSGSDDSYRVAQIDVAVEKYLTDRTGYGFEYQQSKENGDSPFQFDTPYTSRELDGRFQIGYPRVIVGGLVKYSLVGGNVFSEELLIAPILRTIIPRFTYDFATNSFGLGFDIQGLTF